MAPDRPWRALPYTSSRPRSIRAFRDAGRSRTPAHGRRLTLARGDPRRKNAAPRNRRSTKWVSRVSLSFFFRPQAPLNAARIHLNPESLLDGLDQLFRSERRIFDSLLGDKLHHLVGEFVSRLRTAFLRKQAGYSVLLKRRLCLVERGARETEGTRRLADGVLVDVNLTQHLVLDLQQVVGIEEIAVLK